VTRNVPVVVGVDCSTTGAKAVAFAADGTTVAEARRCYPRHSPRPGWQEQDPEDWWRATRDALGELAAALTARGVEPVALSITHQRETFACLDRDGRALRPAVMWLDTRAVEQIGRRLVARRRSRCGLGPHAGGDSRPAVDSQ
jgi:xylulokinase